MADFEVIGWAELDLQFALGDAPVRSFRLRTVDADQNYASLKLAGKTVDLIAKTDPNDLDANALFTYVSGGAITIDDNGAASPYSKITVRWVAADLVAHPVHSYRVRVVTAGQGDTVIVGTVVAEGR